MRLVEIARNVLVNPDRIDAVELITLRGREVLVVYVSGRKFTATVAPREFLETLATAGVDLTKQFFAG